ncbi:transcription termination factor 2-like [Branchiostoma floridae]|uniref:Transcription termination factor 2 n=1 Tax=Branchiostoma floridae TaxID=7739 RepID=A0A9J7MN94_BRAFL|nr:transcription termination factor 2-like [Branchiostoma floridae]
MEVVLCQGHGKPCMLKTGLSEGPNKGKSFYICSQMPQSCGFNKRASIPPSGCLKHAGKTIELQRLHRDQETGQKWLCYRCQVTKDATKGKGWCGQVPHQGTADKRVTKTDHVDSKKQWRLAPQETTSDSDSSEESEDSAPCQSKPPWRNPFYKEAKKEGQTVASSGKKLDVLEKNSEKENLMKYVDDNKIYDSNGGKHADPGRDKSLSSGRGAARDDPVCVEKGGSKSDRERGGETLNAEQKVPNAGGTDVSKVDEKKGKKSEGKESSKGLAKQVLPKSKTGEVVKGSDRSKQPQGKEDEVIVLSDDEKDQVKSTQSHSADVKVKQGAMQNQPLKEDVVKPKQTVAEGPVTNQPITAVHMKQQPITAFPGFQPASQLMSRADAALRADLVDQLRKKEELVKKVQLSVLPDGGKKLKTQIEDLEKAIRSIDLGVSQGQPQGVHIHQQYPSKHHPQGDKRVLPTHAQPLPAHVLQQMYAPHPQGQTLYGGRMTASRLQQVAGVTSEAIERLHKSLESCPPPEAEMGTPASLRVSLLPHQRQALAWLTWREGQHPSGGILADDMGLGKTLTMISLILTQRQNKDTRNKTKVPAPEGVVKSCATLVVCPASLILHWKAEVERHTEDGTLRVYLYHGQNRTKDHTELVEYDLVLSTYELVRKECSSWAAEVPTQDGENGENQSDSAKPRGPMPVLLRVIWDRIILDEAHAIKNHKSQTSVAACQLRAHSRWAMTGTPIQNDLMDMYPLLRFLRCSPFDEMKVWKKWVDNKTANGKARLNTLVTSLLLRRTKGQEGRDGRPLVRLPRCSRISHVIKLSEDERTVYDKFYQDTRKTFQNYLLQHGEKENLKDTAPPSVGTVQPVPAGDPRSAAGQHSGALLRLRQCCCHLSLMKEAVDQETFVNEGIDLTLEQQLREMSLQDSNQTTTPSNSDLPSKDAEKSSMFHHDKPSTKIQKVLSVLESNRSKSTPDNPVKSVIVSQWTKMLDVIGRHLEQAGYRYVVIKGGVPPRQRMEAVEQFNRNPKGPEVLLVSLQAGGVGLNLIGGSHLFLLDMHWNPALEDQASDRIYRVGQKNDVVIHKFVCKDTVEEKIKDLQNAKKNLAQGVLSGGDVGKQKLSLADLRQLFGL